MSDDELRTECNDIISGAGAIVPNSWSDERVIDLESAQIVARALLARLDADRWIPCTERMPDVRDVLAVVVTDKFTRILPLQYRSGGIGFVLGIERSEVTHWRLLPAPPAEVAP